MRVHVIFFAHKWDESVGRRLDDAAQLEQVRYRFDMSRPIDQQVETLLDTVAENVRAVVREVVAA